MMQIRHGVLVAFSAAAAVLLAGCSTDSLTGATGCTDIGSLHGLGVTVAADLAPVRSLVLDVCTDAGCRHQRVPLRSGTSVASQGCTDTGPDGTCSAALTADGTQVGFVEMELPVGTVQVSGRYRAAGRTVTVPAAGIDVTTSYPDGPDCGADGTQGQVTLDSTGLR